MSAPESSSEPPGAPSGVGLRTLRIVFPPELPISRRAPDIAAAIREHAVVIVAGATGSGKTTQLPKVALQLGRGQGKRIGVTQPRRIAATSVAARVASELECPLGREVGYQIRFDNRTGPDTRLAFMTDGVLLAEIQADRLLRRYDTLIIDEAHERSLTIDFLLGWLKRILPKRPDLKLIISSATIETERFSQFFDGAPIVDVEGRTYPVDVLYEPPDPELDLVEATANATLNVASLDPHGDILVFLPGEREIRETERELAKHELRHTTVQPLYARLSAADQSKVFAPISGRRIILATNVAETSLTLPGVVYVVDTGVARLSRYEPRTGTTRLSIEAISQASADQRKGRCGRVREGICVRLYDESSFALRPAFTDPEIKRTGLAAVILRMKALGLGDVEDFPFLDAPEPRSISEGYRVLVELGALDEARELTSVGKRLAKFPVDPRIGRMILEGNERGCLRQILVVAAALELNDPRERPHGLEQKADQLHRRFEDERSDFVGLLRLWHFIQQARQRGTSQLKRACKENFLSFVRVREWIEVERQLAEVVREAERDRRPGQVGRGRELASASTADAALENTDALHQALLSGLLSRVGQYNPEQRVYFGARQTRFAVHPASALSKKSHAWIMAFELVETTRLFARMVARFEPVWLDDIAGHLLQRSYAEPHWSESSARAKIRERATLYGLPVLKDRQVDYSKVAPVRARLMFLEHALVRGEYTTRAAFAVKNAELVAEVSRLRDKARKSELLADEESRLAFFDKRVPASITDGTSFEAWREKAERGNPNLLHMSLSDVLGSDERLVPEDYPDVLCLHGVELALSYCFDPARDDDGISVHVPLALLLQLEPGELDWTISAWQAEKIQALLESLNKAQRRELGAVAQLSSALAAQLVPFKGPLLPALCRGVFEHTGVELTPSAFRVDAVPAYLRFNCRVLGERGKVIAESRDVALLIKQYGQRAREAFQRAEAPASWQQSGLTSWSFGELPQFVTRDVAGSVVRSHPALVDRQKSVELTLLESMEAARSESRAGVRRLCALSAARQLAAFERRLPPPFPREIALPPSRSELELFRDRVALVVVEEAFELGRESVLPRTRHDFDALAERGKRRVDAAFARVLDMLGALASEHDKLKRALTRVTREPSGTQAALEIQTWLEALVPPRVLLETPLERLEQLPRYLRAAQVRLERAIGDPRKDADKLASLWPVWSSFLEKRTRATDLTASRELRWAFEELRVAIFAPELKPAFSVSVQSLSRAVTALR